MYCEYRPHPTKILASSYRLSSALALPQMLSLHVLAASSGTRLVKSSRDTAETASTKPDVMLKLIAMDDASSVEKHTHTRDPTRK